MAAVAPAPLREPLEERPYELDADARRVLSSFWSAHQDGRTQRCSELAQRLVALVEAAGWPAHSFALAVVRGRAAISLARARLSFDLAASEVELAAQGKRGFPPPSHEETRLLNAAATAVLARADAGSLLCCTLSEDAFVHRPEQSLPPPGSLGVAAACLVSTALFQEITVSLLMDHPILAHAAEAHVATLLRLLSHIAAARRDPACLLARADVRLPEETALLACLGHTLEQWESSGPAISAVLANRDETIATLRSARLALYDAYGGAESVRRSIDPMQIAASNKACVVAKRAGWAPRACALCGAPEVEPKQWKQCAQCHSVVYCCREHQKAHWKAGHKRECRAPDERGGGAATA